MLTLIGTSHHTTSIGVRERFAYDAADAEAALRHIIARAWADEAVLLSTCNRTELYTCGDAPNVEQLTALLAAHAGLEPIEAQQYLEVKTDTECVEHLYRVTAGMESLIVGEAQIQGQIKEAFERANRLNGEAKVVGPQLSRLFQGALAVGGRIRSQTDLGSGTASAPGAAVSLARKVLGRLSGKRVLVIGAGRMSALILKHLAHEEAASITVVSRTRASAAKLARRWRARAATTSELPVLIASHDLIITATSCPTTIMSAATIAAARAHLRDSLCIVDIALPRDTDPAVAALPNVFLFDVDDLTQLVDANLQLRHGQWPIAEHLIAAGVAEYRKWYEARLAVPLITRVRAEAERVRQHELERALKALEHLAPADRERIEILTQQLVNKVLHGPTVRLRAAAATDERDTVLQAASYLFE